MDENTTRRNIPSCPSQNLVDGVDVPLSMTRAELATLSEGELGKIRSLVRGCLEDASTEAGSLAGAQVFGGGCRMPIVQDVVREEVKWGVCGSLLEGGQGWSRMRACKVAACDSSWCENPRIIRCSSRRHAFQTAYVLADPDPARSLPGGL